MAQRKEGTYSPTQSQVSPGAECRPPPQIIPGYGGCSHSFLGKSSMKTCSQPKVDCMPTDHWELSPRPQSLMTLMRSGHGLRDPRQVSCSSPWSQLYPFCLRLLSRSLALHISCLGIPRAGSWLRALSLLSQEAPHHLQGSLNMPFESFSSGESEWHSLALNYTSSYLAPVLQTVLTILPRPDHKCPQGREYCPSLCDATKTSSWANSRRSINEFN